MVDKRTLTVSVTINLGNYENLKLEVTDTAETLEEADGLRRFLADVLDGYGNNNATAKSSIDKYKDRILAEKESESVFEESAFEPVSLPNVDDPENTTVPDLPLFMSFGDEPETKETASAEPIESSDTFEVLSSEVAPEPVISPQVRDESPLPQAPVTAPIHEPQPHSEFVCSKCGAPVTKMQRDISMLFNHKILCKDCMK